MPIKHLDHLNLTVRNFAETAEWYSRVFGFRIVERGVRQGRVWGVLRSGEALLCIYENPQRAFLDGDELEHRALHGVNHFSLRIEDETAWEATVIRENLKLGYGGAVRYPHSTSWYVTDPTGYEIEVVRWDADQVRFG
jgi:catechol 2,3-dioxygenase-like lactoylglutathione lyase family enzyme